MDLTLAECAQLGETITGRPLTDISTNWLPPVTICWPRNARPATTILTSKWGARQSATSPQSAKSLCGWTVLCWRYPKPQWLSTAGCKFISEESPTCISETLYITCCIYWNSVMMNFPSDQTFTSKAAVLQEKLNLNDLQKWTTVLLISFYWWV